MGARLHWGMQVATVGHFVVDQLVERLVRERHDGAGGRTMPHR